MSNDRALAMKSPTTTTDTQTAARKTAWQERLGCFGCCLAPLVVACLLVAVSVLVRRLGLSPDHAAPSPTGMIARFELPPAHYIAVPEVDVRGHAPMVIESDFFGDSTIDHLETDSKRGCPTLPVRCACVQVCAMSVAGGSSTTQPRAAPCSTAPARSLAFRSEADAEAHQERVCRQRVRHRAPRDRAHRRVTDLTRDRVLEPVPVREVPGAVVPYGSGRRTRVRAR